MRIYIVRDVKDSTARYRVYDSTGNEKYNITGKYGVLGDTMRICDKDGNRLFKILQTSPPLPITVYSLSGTGERVNLTFSHMRKSFSFMGISWFVKGLAPVYEVFDADKTVIMKQTVESLNKGYAIDINCENRELLCIAIAVCINSINTTTEMKPQTV